MTSLRTLILLATLTLAHTLLLPLSAQETERVQTTDTITTEIHTPETDTLTIDTTRLLAIPGKIIKEKRYTFSRFDKIPGRVYPENELASQLIGYMGSTGNSTGPHVHFEVWRGSNPYTPGAYNINPWSIY